MDKLVFAFVLFLLLLACPFLHAAEASLDTVDVYLVPLDDFPESLASGLAKAMSRETKMWFKGALKMGDLNISTIPGTNQLATEDIIEKSQEVLKRLPESSNKTYYLLLTTRDINSQSGGTRFLFSGHSKELNTSVVSMARMFNYVDGKPVVDVIVAARLLKMMTRAVGEIHLGWKRSTNIVDVMYSPIMGLDDLDRIGTKYLGISQSDHLVLSRVEDNYMLSLPQSQLELSIPVGQFSKQTVKIGGATDNPRYFQFADSQGLVLSGWFEPSNRYKGIDEIKDEVESVWKKTGFPKATNVETNKVGRWDTVFYQQPKPTAAPQSEGYSLHARAELVQAGTWVDLHISITTKDFSATSRATIENLLNSIVINEKSSAGIPTANR